MKALVSDLEEEALEITAAECSRIIPKNTQHFHIHRIHRTAFPTFMYHPQNARDIEPVQIEQRIYKHNLGATLTT